MLELDQENHDAYIRDIDAMARAAYMWVRQQTLQRRFVGVPVSSAEEYDLAAGFLAGIKGRLGLEDTESTMLTYIYLLMQGEQVAAIRKVGELTNRPRQTVAAEGYQRGLQAARDIFNEGQPVSQGFTVPIRFSPQFMN